MNLYSGRLVEKLSQFYVLWYSESIKLSSCSQRNPGPSGRDPTGSIIGGVLCSKTSLDMFIANREFFPLFKKKKKIFTGGLILIESP